jgi:hypothetical protein
MAGGLPRDYPMVAFAYAARRLALAKQLGLETALHTAEQSAEAPHVPVKVEEPTVPVAEPQHTAASVFAKSPGAEAPAEALLPSEARLRRPDGSGSRSNLQAGRKKSGAGGA